MRWASFAPTRRVRGPSGIEGGPGPGPPGGLPVPGALPSRSTSPAPRSSREMSKRPRRRPAAAPPAPPAPTLSNDLSRWLAPVVLVLVTAVAYLPTFANGFVNFDDIEKLLKNPAHPGPARATLRSRFSPPDTRGALS